MTIAAGATEGILPARSRVPGPRSRVPGDYWREVLAESIERDGTRWSVTELLGAVAGCEAGIVQVAGWLCDEMAMHRVQHPDAWPEHYELSPGVRPYHTRLRR
jgi:hypothetical protein